MPLPFGSKVGDLTTGWYKSTSILCDGTSSFYIISLPTSVFNHLRVEIYGRTLSVATTSDPITVNFNGDVGANYSYIPSGGAQVNGSQIRPGNLPGASGSVNYAGHVVMNVPFYNDATFYKAVSAAGGSIQTAAAATTASMTGLWLSTAAITSITIGNIGGGAFAANTRINIYVWV